MQVPETGTLKALRRKMLVYYHGYKKGEISEQEYLVEIKPIDAQIDRIELSLLKALLHD